MQGSDIYELAVEMEKHAKKLVNKTRRLIEIKQQEKPITAKKPKPAQASQESNSSKEAAVPESKPKVAAAPSTKAAKKEKTVV